jgi:simple sugar transport system permease protein
VSNPPIEYARPGTFRRAWWRPSRQQVPVLTTAVIVVLLYLLLGWTFPVFFTGDVAIGLLRDNSAFLGVTAVGMTFVILSGGIDLSVGAMIGCTSIAMAAMIGRGNVHPGVAMAIVLAGGVALGALMGCLIQFFELPPFLVTLAGLFFLRGLALWISVESMMISHPWYDWLSGAGIPLPWGLVLPLSAVIFLVVLVMAIGLSLWTPFGRNVYAIGGSESSAVLMGLPVGRTKVMIYALSGFCSALGGIVYTISLSSGDATAGSGLELDAIAAVVVGGTLLTGGVGYVAGTLLGILIFGMIQRAIIFKGNLNSAWTSIAVGALLLAFILLQKLLELGRGRAGESG